LRATPICSHPQEARDGRHVDIDARAHRRLSLRSRALRSTGAGTAQHLFCSVCGIKSFYIPRSHPDGYSVNARCLDEGTVEGMDIDPFDGREWEKQYPEGRGVLPDQ
jgi:hypothetical protein